jgi:putative Ca2+/H+ antiporter (TMEM165/GDT1 family)
MKAYVAVFLTVLLAELGDKTQLATLLFATNPELRKVGVLAAAAGALVLSTAAAVLVGDQLGRWVPAGTLKAVAGAGFIALGLWMLLTR